MRRPLACLLVLSLAAPAAACLWDYDTLEMERQRFSGALELIVGKFLRHSDEFYEWRVKDRQAKIAAHDAGTKKLSDAALAAAYDDLAVALDKLGRHDAAIAEIRTKADRLPQTGEYETHANLGSFLVHAGRYEEGLAELKAALAINPDAHFGREEYQVLVVEYLLEKRSEDGTVPQPLDDSMRQGMMVPPFVQWLLVRRGLASADGPALDQAAADREVERAVKGVLGMMRFGDYRSPVLLEVLGDLLLTAPVQETNLGERLAARAYLRASEAVPEGDARHAYREMSQYVLSTQSPDKNAGELDSEPGEETYGLSRRQLEDQLAREVHEADDWFAGVRKDELLWIRASTDPNPDVRFWEKYGRQTVKVGYDRLPPAHYAKNGLPWAIRAGLAGGLAATGAVLAGLLWWRKRRPNGYETDDAAADRP